MVISDVPGVRLWLSVMPRLDCSLGAASDSPLLKLRCWLFHRLCGIWNDKQATYHPGMSSNCFLEGVKKPAFWAGRPGSASQRNGNAGRTWGCVRLEEPTSSE